MDRFSEILPYAPITSSRANTLESKVILTNTTPQKDFLTKNLARLNHAPMAKASSFDSARKIEELKACLNSENSPALMHSENGAQKHKNPFSFAKDFENSNQPIKPPRSGQTSPKPLPDTPPKTPTSTGPPKLGRQISESPMKKIQATLQRTFSRKGSNSHEGHANDGFTDDESRDTLAPVIRKISEKKLNTKAPLSKSLSMPDMENRLKKRERIRTYVEFRLGRNFPKLYFVFL